jgi:hypothetical protein
MRGLLVYVDTGQIEHTALQGIEWAAYGDQLDRNGRGLEPLQHRTDRSEGIRPTQWPSKPQRWGSHPSLLAHTLGGDDSVRIFEVVGRAFTVPSPPTAGDDSSLRQPGRVKERCRRSHCSLAGHWERGLRRERSDGCWSSPGSCRCRCRCSLLNQHIQILWRSLRRESPSLPTRLPEDPSLLIRQLPNMEHLLGTQRNSQMNKQAGVEF